jgi:hypothetical protein
MVMDFTFDFGWVIGGIVIAAAGGAIVYFHKQIADNLASGVSSYEKVKLFGVITTVIGLIIMANLHTLILTFLVKIITGNW